MKKAELEQYATPTLPKSRREAVYRTQSVQYILRSEYSPDRNTLIVAFYGRESAANGFSLPVGVLYLREDEYLTKTTKGSEVKWRECRLHRALEMGYSTESVCLTQIDQKRILAFLKRWSDFPQYYEENQEKPIEDLLEQFQTDILARRLKKTKERRAAKVDLRMAEVPRRLPKSFSRWADETPLLHSRYVYYQYLKKNLASCFCTHCQQEFLMKKGKAKPFPAHKKEGRCPHCGSALIFKVISRTRSFEDHENAAVMQRTKKGEAVVRFFSLWRHFDKPCSLPRTGYYENGRLFLSPKGEITGEYKYGHSASMGRYGWYPVKDQLAGRKEEIDFHINLGMFHCYENLWFEKRYMFPANLHPMLKRLNLSFDLKRVFRSGKVDVTSYLLRSFRYPFAPSLHRIGLEQVGRGLLAEYFDSTSGITSGPLHKQLGISKKELGWVRESGWGMQEIGFMAALRDPAIQKDEVQWFVEHKIAVEAIRPFRQLTTYHRMIRYTEEQKQRLGVHYAYSSIPRVIKQWQDYLKMCEKLDYDRKQDRVLFPRDLGEEHDKLVQLIQVRENAEADQKIQELYPGLKQRYLYEEAGYLIRPPRNFEDFVKEGASLTHCVCAAGYYKGHIAGDHLIFFVRGLADAEKPLYTLEYDVKRQKVLQLRGHHNRTAPPEVKAFVDRWIKQRCQKDLRKQAV